jgi:hypothetical protein
LTFVDNSRRHEEDSQIPHEKQVEDMRDSLDYAFATGKKSFTIIILIYFLF